jgi:hypothetical protein
MAIHILIPTLQGVSKVQSIVQEDSDVPSVVCLNGSSQSLPISNAYYDFVKKGQGLIAKDFGHEAWRVDLSEPVEMGKSWQLGLYLAHYFHSKGQLGVGDPKSGDTVIWATGEVKVIRDVEPVDGVDRKLAHSSVLFNDYQAQQISTLVVMCGANHAVVDLPNGTEGVILDSVADLSPLLKAISKYIYPGDHKGSQSDDNVNSSKQSKVASSERDLVRIENRNRGMAYFGVIALLACLFVILKNVYFGGEAETQQRSDTQVALDDSGNFPPEAAGRFDLEDELHKMAELNKASTFVSDNLKKQNNTKNELMKPTLQTESSSVSTLKPVMLIKTVEPFENCQEHESKLLTLFPNELRHFKSQPITLVCDIRFSLQGAASVLVYSLDSGLIFSLNNEQNVWSLPMPKQQNTKRAVIVSFEQEIDAKDTAELKRFFDINIEKEWMNALNIQQLVTQSGRRGAQVHGFTLESY